jgi:hypothetical protein
MTGIVPSAAESLGENLRYNAEAWEELRHSQRFVHLEVKSLPRSGLHFLSHQLSAALGEKFSFCEWYQEPGCCRSMPCRLSLHLGSGVGGDRFRLRMTKSHDFDLADPAYPTGGALRRLILVREPIYLLTSWWALDLLAFHSAALQNAGISPTLIHFRHEAAVYRAAYRALDSADLPDSPEEVSQWLGKRHPYVLGFVRKWAGLAARSEDAMGRLVRYHAIPEAVGDLLQGMEEQPSGAGSGPVPRGGGASPVPFASRPDPFRGPTERVSESLLRNRALFEGAAAALCREDETGTLSWATGDDT